MQHRPDIDGLRALAVLPVVLYHAGADWFSGGFVGVDVFFVISGYLITRTLCEDHAAGRFSLVSFYERRIRRIVPAFVVVVVVTCLVGFVLFAPKEYLSLSKSVVAAIAFLSNVFFFRQTGYFDEASELKPLLHTWSLSVEEQFYIVFPIVLYACYRLAPKAVVPILLALAAASLSLSVWATGTAPEFNFFLPLTRAWELLVGAILATSAMGASAPLKVREALAWTGLALILAPIHVYDPTTPFPGLAAIPPTVGAALLIMAAPGTVPGRILSLRPLAYVGLMSYSLYLWHWPILVFARYVNLEPLGGAAATVAVGAALVVSAWSLVCVERPFRKRDAVGRRTIFVGAGAASACLLALGVVGTVSDGFLLRARIVDPAVVDAEEASAGLQKDHCLRRGATTAGTDECIVGAPNRALAPTVALWGDSHAAHLAPALDELGKTMNVRVKLYTKAGCAPVLAERFEPPRDMLRHCPEYNRAVLAELKRNPNLNTVVLAGRWDSYARNATLAFDGRRAGTAAGSHAILIESLETIAAEMARRGGKLIIVDQVPMPPGDPTVCVRAVRHHGWVGEKCETYAAGPSESVQELVSRTLFEPLRKRGAALQIVEVRSAFCTGEKCAAMNDGQLLYMDSNHLSPQGAGLIGKRVAQAIP